MKKIPYEQYRIRMNNVNEELENFDILKIGGRYFRSSDEDMYYSEIIEIEKDEFMRYKKYALKDKGTKKITENEKKELKKHAEEGLDFIHEYLGY